jgi:hypothetical protein
VRRYEDFKATRSLLIYLPRAFLRSDLFTARLSSAWRLGLLPVAGLFLAPPDFTASRVMEFSAAMILSIHSHRQIYIQKEATQGGRSLAVSIQCGATRPYDIETYAST